MRAQRAVRRGGTLRDDLRTRNPRRFEVVVHFARDHLGRVARVWGAVGGHGSPQLGRMKAEARLEPRPREWGSLPTSVTGVRGRAAPFDVPPAPHASNGFNVRVNHFPIRRRIRRWRAPCPVDRGLVHFAAMDVIERARRRRRGGASQGLGLPLGSALAGNDVTLLADAAHTFPRMLDAIASAEDHVHVETYRIQSD